MLSAPTELTELTDRRQEPTVRLYVCAANVYRVRTLRLCNLFGRGSVHARLLITSQLARPRLGMISSCCGCSQSRSIWSSTTTFNMYRSGNLPYQPEGTEIQKHINTYNIGLESLLTLIFLLYPTCSWDGSFWTRIVNL